MSSRIREAESAIQAGHLDSALDVLTSPDLAAEPRARELAAALASRLLERGQDFLLSRRFDRALADFDRAARCGQLLDKVAQWRRRAVEAMQAARQADAEKQAIVNVARERLAEGSLAGARAALARGPAGDGDLAALAEEIDRQASRAEELVQAGKRALADGDVSACCEAVRRARRLDAAAEGLANLEREVLERVLGDVQESFREGRLIRARRELDVLGELARRDADRLELEESLRLAGEAARALGAHRYHEADLLLGRLERGPDSPAWVAESRKQLAHVEDHLRLLLGGPLGALAGPAATRTVNDDETRPARPLEHSRPRLWEGEAPAEPAAPVPAAQVQTAHLPGRLILRIDGVGSFLLLRSERIAIGRAGSSADLELLSDLSERHAEIVRAGEDYFIVSAAGVQLAGRPVEHALLRDGDRLRLGRRVCLTFRRPSMKSAAALLDLGDGVRTTGECRRVILWGGPVLLGGSSDCHVVFPGLSPGLVLVERGGRAIVKLLGAETSGVILPIGTPVEIAGLCMSLSACGEPPGPAGRVIG